MTLAMHFTGKERDTESGLDNFGARYNASSMGRVHDAGLGGQTQRRCPTQTSAILSPSISIVMCETIR
jgi:hypothetical protein